MSILDQAKQQDYGQAGTRQGQYDCTPQKILAQYPSMSVKLDRVAELFELDVLNEEEALKACKVIIGQHAKVTGEKGTTVK